MSDTTKNTEATKANENTEATKNTEATNAPAGSEATAKPKTEKPKNEKRVQLMVPRGRSNEDPNLLISVNGMNYLLPRGKMVSVPAHVAYEYNRALRAEAALYEKQDEMIKQGQMPKPQGAVV